MNLRPCRLLALACAVAGCAFARAALDTASIDPAAAPCADFYRYANQRWLDATPIPEDRERWSTFEAVALGNERVLAAALEALRANPPAAGSAQRKAVDFYASGMDAEAIERAGLAPIEPLLARIAALERADELPALLARLHAHGVEAGFAFAVRPDARQSERYLAQIVQDGLGLPDRDYYFRDDARSRALREEYAAHVARLLTLAGTDREAAARDAATVLAMETELARASMTAVERRDVDRTYHRVDLATLAREAPGFAWRDYAAGIGAPGLERVNVAQPAFAAAFARMAAEHPIAGWRAYLRWHTLHATSRVLPEAFAAERFAFYETALRGRATRSERPREVIDIIGGRYGTEPMAQAMAMIFVDKAFTPGAKARAGKMVEGIKAALRERIATLEWMGPDTRRRALEKLAAMRIQVGYPDRWRDFSDADLGHHAFADNWMRAKGYFLRWSVARIGGDVDRAEWFAAPHIVNAFYNRSGNEIVFPAGILQPPFFDAAADDALNYGGIGSVVGHEITHGFDDNGRRFDARGNLADWWSAEDARRYLERSERVERQYDAYSGVDGIAVNGKLTLGENLSDVGGVKIAYLALQHALEGKGRAPVDGFPPEQRFFLAFAQIWRNKSRPEFERLQLRTDPHSPPRFRVAGVLANLPEFARAFSCTDAGPLLPEARRANIW